MPLSTQTDLYMNMQQFSDMKLAARNQSSDASKAVAEQFESLFVQQMLSSMRSAATVDPASHNSYGDFYQEMYDKQLALDISRQGGLGIARLILQQLPDGQDTAGKAASPLPPVFDKTTISSLNPEQMNYQPLNPAVVVRKLDADINQTSQPGSSGEAASDNIPPSAEFIRNIWPYADKAANSLGISTRALVAQSVLETGWGKHQMEYPDGQPTHNLFGIKAGNDWTGATLTKPTLEFSNGVMQTEVAHFRAYATVADSLNDYVQFIRSRPRYQAALNHQGNDESYFKGLQQAGYATDPDYASKIRNIMNGPTFNQALAILPQDLVVENLNA